MLVGVVSCFLVLIVEAVPVSEFERMGVEVASHLEVKLVLVIELKNAVFRLHLDGAGRVSESAPYAAARSDAVHNSLRHETRVLVVVAI